MNTPYNPPPPSTQYTPIVQTFPSQPIQGAHIATPHAQYVPSIYVMDHQTLTNLISVKFQPEVHRYEEMEKDVKAKIDDMLT